MIGVEVGLRVRLAGGPRLAARRILVATGLRDELPEIPVVPERWGRDVLHCPYCHGYEVRDQPLGVLPARRMPSITRCWCGSGRPTLLSSHTPTPSPRTSANS